jgi:hypothetical protein
MTDPMKPFKWLSLIAIASGILGLYFSFRAVWLYFDYDIWDRLGLFDYGSLGIRFVMDIIWIYIGILLYNWSWKRTPYPTM